MTHEELVERCDRHLADLRCTLWGEAFEVKSTRGRREAVEWLASQVEGVLALEPPPPPEGCTCVGEPHTCAFIPSLRNHLLGDRA